MPKPRPVSRLLIDEPPLIVLPSLAAAIGLEEAVMLQQIHYWLQKSKHLHEGRKWIYNSYPEWAGEINFWTEHQVRRILNQLRKLGLLLTGNFNRLALDRTTWYSIDYEALDALLPSVEINRPSGKIARSSDETSAPSGNNSAPSGRFARPIPETTSERSTETTSEGESDAPPPPTDFEAFTVDAEHLAWWATIGLPPGAVDVAAETAIWRDMIRSGSRPRPTDPAADWRIWMRRAISHYQKHGGPHGSVSAHGRHSGPSQQPPEPPSAAAEQRAAADLVAALDALAGPGSPAPRPPGSGRVS